MSQNTADTGAQSSPLDVPGSAEAPRDSLETLDKKSQEPDAVALRMTREDVLSTFEERESEFDKLFEASISPIDCVETGKINKIDISPQGEAKDVVFLAPGWLETLQTNKYLIRSLVELGYRVVSLDHPRHGGSEKSADTRHLAAISAVKDSLPGDIGNMVGMGSSLGAIDIAQYADPERNPSAHECFSNFVLLNPAGLNGKGLSKVGDVAHLFKSYAFGHMRQGGAAKKLFKGMDENARALDYREDNPEDDSAALIDPQKDIGVPITAIADYMKGKMTKSGMDDLHANRGLAFKEAVRVGGTRIQKELGRLRANGHGVFVFSAEQDKLLPGSEYNLKVADGEGLGPKGKNLKYGRPDAEADKVIQVAGYHNSFRAVAREDSDNDQWMAIVWIDSLLRHLRARQ